MSSCAPTGLLGTEPDYVPVLYGFTDLTTFGGTLGDGNWTDGDGRNEMIWDEYCDGSHTRILEDDEWPEGMRVASDIVSTDLIPGYHGPDFSASDILGLPGAPNVVECKIESEQEWNRIWADAVASGKEPYKFVEEPIEWIRYELGGLVKASIHWWTEVDDPLRQRNRPDVCEDPDGLITQAVCTPINQFWDARGDVPYEDPIYTSILDSTLFLAGVVAVISLLFVAGRMALQRDSRPARELVRAMLTLVVVTGVGLVFTKLLIQAGDAFGDYFIVNALPAVSDADTGGADPCNILDHNIEQISMNFEEMNFFAFLICAALFLVGALVLYLIMTARILVVTLVAALLPLSASATATSAGKEWFGKQISLLFAFILMKPCAVIIFVTSLRFADRVNSGSSLAAGLASAAFLAMGTILLPALTRLVFPFTSAAAQGEGTAMALVPRVTGATVARGAIRKIRGGGS